MNLALVCVGGGSSSRFGGDKLAEPLGRRCVFASAIAAVTRAFPEAPLVVVAPADNLAGWRDRLQPDFPEARLIAGGPRRQDSVRAGVELAIEGGGEVVAVHDAARPLVHPNDVRAVVSGLGEASGAILSSRVTDTVKRADEDRMVVDTVPRGDLYFAQTPQVFRTSALVEAWRTIDPVREWTDESTLLEWAGFPVRCVVAKFPNPKLTTEADLGLMRSLMAVE
jgi:2-C-methyl-D-erythritol 4-phosphate cytidylyltransferase